MDWAASRFCRWPTPNRTNSPQATNSLLQMPDLEAADITKHYATRAEPLEVLRGVSLSLSRGENLCILGPSGCGKSTLLHILGTLDQPSSGKLQLEGRNLLTLDEPPLATFRNGKIGFVFQDHHLLPQCSVLENVLLPTIAEKKTAPKQVERARMLLERVGLAERIDHRPAELSGGERQRAAVARALINQPALLLADEPTGNLDETTAASVAQLLLDLQRQDDSMLIVVTHSIDIASRFDACVRFDHGTLAEVRA
jgi:lipoprotein-releasing system ATP-binding protein